MDDNNSPYIVAAYLSCHYSVRIFQCFVTGFLDLSFPNTMSAQAALEEVLLQQSEYSQAYTPLHNTSSEHKCLAEQQPSSHASNSLYETGVLIAMSALCLSHTLKLW